MLIYASIGVGLFVALILFKIVFEDFDDFIDCIKFWLQGDFISMLTGEREEYRWDTLRIFLWIAISGAGGVCAYFQLPKWFRVLSQ